MPICKIIIGFFLLLFSFQLAPVQQVGSLLYSNQITEEMPHSQETGNVKYPDDGFKHFESAHSVSFRKRLQARYFISGKGTDVRVITRSADDIQTPPPNKTV